MAGVLLASLHLGEDASVNVSRGTMGSTGAWTTIRWISRLMCDIFALVIGVQRPAAAMEWRLLERKAEAGRKAVGNRLAYYWREPGRAFWDEHWRRHINEKRYRSAEKGSLGDLRDAFLKHLPKEGKILEAGCGSAHRVLALQVRGYDCQGIEFAERTVAAVRAMRPSLPVSVGDVTRLDVPDGHYSGYISLGVIEHTEAGPDQFLVEARRVLSDGGVAIITVPHFHTLRRLKAWLRLYPKPRDGLHFYQYAFTPADMTKILERNGFEVIDGYRYNCIKGLGDELPLVSALANHPTHGPSLKRWMKQNRFLNWHFGHMVVFVCRKSS
jgi:SAM-dependent methyltransferase